MCRGLLLGRHRRTVLDCLTVSRPQRLLSERDFNVVTAVKTNKLCEPCSSAVKLHLNLSRPSAVCVYLAVFYLRALPQSS